MTNVLGVSIFRIFTTTFTTPQFISGRYYVIMLAIHVFSICLIHVHSTSFLFHAFSVHLYFIQILHKPWSEKCVVRECKCTIFKHFRKLWSPFMSIFGFWPKLLCYLKYPDETFIQRTTADICSVYLPLNI